MTRDEITKQLTEIIRDILADDQIVLTDTTTAAEVPGWDSFNHINLVVATEKAFNVRFRIQEIEGLRNVGEFVDIIKQRAANA